MYKPPKPRHPIVDFFFPGPNAYDQLRSRRMLVRGLLAAVAIAIIFGVALYCLCNTRRY